MMKIQNAKEIQKHLDDFGLIQDFGTYGKIGGLSGEKKVKRVVAAAMCLYLLHEYGGRNETKIT